MKKTTSILALGFALLFQFTACYKTVNINHKNGVKGSGNLVSSVIEVEEFNELELNVAFDIELVVSNEEKVILNIDDNLIDFIDVENIKGKLIIAPSKGTPAISKSKGKIEIHFKSLNHITNASVGSLTSNTLIEVTNLYIKNTSVGDTNLNLDVTNLEINNSSVGNLTLMGKATNFNLKNSGVGNVNAQKLISNNLDLNNSAVGDTKIYVYKDSRIKNSAVGDLKIYGPGKIDQIKNTGIGKFSKQD